MNGKLRATKESYQKRNDKAFFERIAKRYNAEELKNFYVANFMDDKHYILDMVDEDANAVYYDQEKRKQSLSYHFSNDLDHVFLHGVKHPFEVESGEYPYLLSLHLRNKISNETMIILNDFVSYFDKFNREIGKDDVIWSKVSFKLLKYRPFMKYDKDKCKAILKRKIMEYDHEQG